MTSLPASRASQAREALSAYRSGSDCPGIEIEPGRTSGCGGDIDCPTHTAFDLIPEGAIILTAEEAAKVAFYVGIIADPPTFFRYSAALSAEVVDDARAALAVVSGRGSEET